jgi:membrane protein
LANLLMTPKTGARFRLAWTLFRDTFRNWNEDKASRLAAALSYYTIFSIAPLLILVIAIAGWVFDKEVVSNQLFDQIRELVGEAGASTVQTMVQSAEKSGDTFFAAAIGLSALLLGASGAFIQLQDALNTIWGVQPKHGHGVWVFIHKRLLSFSMVLVIGFILLVSLVLSTVLAAMSGFLNRLLPFSDVLLQMINFAISFGVTALLFTMIFKVLPDVLVKWKDVWIGGVATSLLFSLGRYGISLYLGRGSVSSAYGAAGSFVILLVWIYYSSQILLFGAEFTKVYANRQGAPIQPSPHAEAAPETSQTVR